MIPDSRTPRQANAAGGPVYAGFDTRVAALLIDALLIMGFVLPLYPIAQRQPIPGAVIWIALIWAVTLAYSIVCHARWGRTLGKRMAGIRVVRLDGGAIGYPESLLRSAVDVALTLIRLIALATVVAEWTSPDWTSMSFVDRSLLVRARNPLDGVVRVLEQVWIWSEVVVLLFNKKRRALHDYIAGTVVVVG